MKNFLREWRIKKLLKYSLYAIAGLQSACFVNYLKKDYIKHRMRYQKALNKQAHYFFSIMLKTSAAIKDDATYIVIFSKINHLSEIIFSLNQLRFRVTDYTTFKVCVKELQEIEKVSVTLLKQLADSFFSKKIPFIDLFEEAIHQFENIYNRALQIVSFDPLVFMFFIQDLYALNDELKQLADAIAK